MTGMVVLRPGFLVLLLALPAVWLAWHRWPPPLSRARTRLTLTVRLVLLAVVVLSLADVRITQRPRNRAVVAVVDLSDSAATSADQAAESVRAMIAAKGSDDLFGMVTFGKDAQVELPPTRRPVFTEFQTRPDGSQSDLAGALNLAANLVPDGYSRQVVLLSDGRQNVGDAEAAVDALRARSVRVDVVTMGSPPAAEALVAALDAPGQLRAGERVSVVARLRSTAAARGRLTLSLDGREIASRDVALPSGSSD